MCTRSDAMIICLGRQIYICFLIFSVNLQIFKIFQMALWCQSQVWALAVLHRLTSRAPDVPFHISLLLTGAITERVTIDRVVRLSGNIVHKEYMFYFSSSCPCVWLRVFINTPCWRKLKPAGSLRLLWGCFMYSKDTLKWKVLKGPGKYNK